MEGLACEPSPGYGEVEAISGGVASSVLKQRGTLSSWRLLELLYKQWVWRVKLFIFFSDYRFACVIDMVEKFLARGYEEVAFISVGLVEVYCFRA